MKKRIAMSALMLIMGITSLLANNKDGINEKAVTNFQKEFRNATEVSWQFTAQFVKVSFTLQEQVFTAYYNEDGEKIAIARNLRSIELPMGLQEELKTSYADYWISDLFEMHLKDETAYYITIENADQKITLKSSGLRDWTHYRSKSKP